MPKFNVTVPHTLSKEDAAAKIRLLLEGVSAKYADKIKDLEQTFENDRLEFSFKTLGLKVTGEGTVDDKEVNIKGDLPIAAMIFKGQIESSIREQLERLLGRPK